MSNILATNPRLEDLIKKQVNEYGLNHGMISDNQGMIMDNEGNTMNYAGSNGVHPNSKVNRLSLKENPKKDHNKDGKINTSDWKIARDNAIKSSMSSNMDEGCGDGEMYEGGCGDGEMYEGCGKTHEEKLNERLIGNVIRNVISEEKPCWFGKCRGKRIRDAIDDAIDKIDDFFGGNYGVNNDDFEDAGYLDNFESGGNMVRPDDVDRTLDKRETREATSSGGASGSYVAPLDFDETDETEEIMERVMRDEVSKLMLENRITNRILNENIIHDCENVDDDGSACFDCCNSPAGDAGECCDAYDAMGLSYGGHDKDIRHGMGSGFKTPQGGSDRLEKFNRRQMNEADVPGISITKKTLKNAKSQNNSYLKSVDKKIKEYLNFKDNSHPEFPHQNNSKTDYKSPMYRNSQEDTDFIDDFRGMGLQDANGADTLDRIDDYLNGSTRTGNSQDAGNAIPSTLGKNMLKNIKRKKAKIAKQKSKMTNLRGMTPDVQTVTNIKESNDIGRMKKLISHKSTGQ